MCDSFLPVRSETINHIDELLPWNIAVSPRGVAKPCYSSRRLRLKFEKISGYPRFKPPIVALCTADTSSRTTAWLSRIGAHDQSYSTCPPACRASYGVFHLNMRKYAGKRQNTRNRALLDSQRSKITSELQNCR
jgi:hypothetical protein